MSAVTPANQKPRKSPRQLTLAERSAIIAACAVPGAHKGNIARDFDIRQETVSRLLRDVKLVQNVSNPLAADYKPALKHEALTAVKRGLKHKADPYKAANIGVRVLEGIGEFGYHVEVDERREVIIRWAGGFDPMLDTHEPGTVIEASAQVVESEPAGDIPT